jgi:triphosphatase
MATEVELKLAISQDAAEAIEASGVIPGKSTTAVQRSIYFDTPDQQLAEAGLTLRIRSSKGKRIQTVKAGDGSASGLFARSEWEQVVESDRPVIDDTTPIRVLVGDDDGDISPLFEVNVERRTWNVIEGESEIEVVLDRGNATIGEVQSPICEIELELKRGDPNALFALARRIDAIAPVRLGVLSKSDRGYRLTRPPVTVFKAERIAIDKGINAAQAFQHIAQSCVRQYRLNEAILFEDRSVEALHQARVAIRRLRSAFSIFKAVLGDGSDATLREELKWLASELGEARNLDVLLERSAPGLLQDRLNTARGQAYATVEAALASTRVRALMLDLAQWISCGSWLEYPDSAERRAEPVHEFAAGTLERLRRRVKKDGRHLVKADDEVRHELRKDAKKLRYAAEFFVAVFDRKKQTRRRKLFIGALEDLQDQLGLLNDLATGPSVLEALGLMNDPDAAALLAGGRKKKLLKAAADAHEGLVDTKPFWR